MQAVLKMFDETPGEPRRDAGTLTLVSEKVTVRGLIRRRVEAEVRKYNEADVNPFRGLVRPLNKERIPNGYSRPKLNADEQLRVATDAFCSGSILLLFNDRQITDLNDHVTLGETAREDALTFIKLVPLVGG